MKAKKFIGEYEIECEISTVSQRHIYFATQKQVLKESLENQTESLQHEYEILNSISHPNIVKPTNLFELENKHYMVTSRADIDLLEYMTDQEISTEAIPKIMQSLISAISFLHSKDIWHRNISPDNILVYKKNLFVLCGFSHAGHFKGHKTDEIHGNPLYMAPELNSEQGYTNKIDCYSLGILMYILYKKNFPFDENNTPRFDAIDFTGIPQEAADLISHLICLNQDERYSAQQALSHKYFENL